MSEDLSPRDCALVEAARTELLCRAVEWLCWSTQQGILAAESEGVQAPEDVLMNWSDVTGDEDWEGLPQRMREHLARVQEDYERTRAYVEELQREHARLTTAAVTRHTDLRYMLAAYRELMGAKARQVVDDWETRGLTRVHTSWGPEADSMTGEERAQVLLDVDRQISSGDSPPSGRAPGSLLPKTSVRDMLAELDKESST